MKAPVQPAMCLTADLQSPNTGNYLTHSQRSTITPLSLWHHRLGHAHIEKLQHIPCIEPYTTDHTQVCLTCPMSKFTKLPFSKSNSCATSAFELLHIDTWEPYKVPYNGKYGFFLTIVDDHTGHTWIYLLQHKSNTLENLRSFFNYASNHFKKSV